MQARFLLGPAGSGKTFRCLAEIREELLRDPAGPPLLLLAPKQATFQLERQLLADGSLTGYTRLQILSFDRLAQFLLGEFRPAPSNLLSEEGRVMVLRALLLYHQSELKIFRAAARLTGFAQQLSALLREFQRHQLGAAKLGKLAVASNSPASLRDKLHDLALILRAYTGWLETNKLQDADHLLDDATALLLQRRAKNPEPVIARLWLDGFAEMTPQELEFLAALVPLCGHSTLAFCLESAPAAELPWLSTWAVVAQTFRRCHAQLTAIDGCKVKIDPPLANTSSHGRFSSNETLRALEARWSSSPPNSQLPIPNSQISLVECPDPEAEAVCAAREIRRHILAGGRFRDCAVIVRKLEHYHATLARVFRRYEIPFFMDRRAAVAHHPLAELTRFAVRTVLFNWRHDDWFGALKTGFASVSDDAIDRLENEALASGWEGKIWRAALPDRKKHFENLRRELVEPFEKFSTSLGDKPNGAQLADALRGLWADLAFEKTLERWNSAAPSPIHDTVLEQMRGWLDNLELAFTATPLPLRDWLPILEAGLANLSVGVVPPALDQVLIGAIDRSRSPELKLALVLGLNEGIFPAPPATGTLLTDTDREQLEAQKIFLGPNARQRLGHERYLGYIACTRSGGRLVLTRAAQDPDGQPLNASPFFDHVRRLAAVPVEKFSAGDWRDAVHACEVETSALRADEGDPLRQIPALAPLIEKSRQLKAAAAPNLSPAVFEKVFGSALKTSVSGLEDFGACPFKFFTARSLRLLERKEFQFDARDKGSFQHEALLEFHRRVQASGRKWRDLTPAEAGDLAAGIGRELLRAFADGKFSAPGAAKFTGEMMIERLRRLVGTLVAWMPQYDFDPAVCEIAFDDEKPGGLPSWRFELGDGRALLLRGRIDRVDLCRIDADTALAVVMDYKSRVRKLDATKLHHGLELQLLSYLGVLKHLGSPEEIFGVKSLAPAGVFYIPLNGSGGKSGASRAEVLAVNDDARRAAYQHSGRFLGDELSHFDNRGRDKGDQFKFAKNKDGEFAKRGNEALPRAGFEALREQVEVHLRAHGRRIFSGEIAASPFRLGNLTACDYCEFRPICRFDPWTQPFRQLRPPPKPEQEDAPRKRKGKPA